MRVACIYFPLSSVGGIATEVRAYKLAAESIRDEFHIFRCPSGPGIKAPALFKEPKRIRGGDTKITIDGEMSHHPKHVNRSVRYLNENYDGVFFCNAVPRPNKAYGKTPFFVPFFEGLDIPAHLHVTDAYVSTYPWVKEILGYVNGLSVVNPAYQKALEAIDITDSRVILAPIFLDEFKDLRPDPRPEHAGERIIIWPNQWKDIKGIKPFLNQVPALSQLAHVELFSNGIRYYQLRTEPEWKAAVGIDHFQGFNGDGDASFYGEVAPYTIAEAMTKAWGSVNLQGLSTRGRHPFYRQGSFNLTEVEALWRGAWPIVADQVRLSTLPEVCCQFVKETDASDLVHIVDCLDAPLRCYPEWSIAQEYVRDNHDAVNLWKNIRKDFA